MNTIIKKEIRMGSIIQSVADVWLVCLEIDCNGITYDRFDGEAVCGHAKWEELKPIKLWGDVMKMCGFTRKKGSGSYRLDINYIDTDYPCTLFQTGDGIQIARSGIGAITAPVDYLHQLQNLYYTLTGKELEIKIPASSTGTSPNEY